jgi:hypothetical protein
MKPGHSDMDCLFLHKRAEKSLDRFDLSCHSFRAIGWPNYLEMDYSYQHTLVDGIPEGFALCCH